MSKLYCVCIAYAWRLYCNQCLNKLASLQKLGIVDESARRVATSFRDKIMQVQTLQMDMWASNALQMDLLALPVEPDNLKINLKEQSMYSQYYVGTGEQTKFFTLRHQFEEQVWFKGEGGHAESAIIMRDYYMQNLSIDREQSVIHAYKLGYKVSAPQFTLQEIKRLEDGQAAALKLAADEALAASQKMKLDQELKLVGELCFPFGRNEGESFEKMIEEKGEGWAGYWMEYGRNEGANATIQLMGKVLEANYPEIARITFMSDSGNGKYYGEVGVRQKLVKVTNVASYGFEGYYGWTYVEKFLTESGELLMYMGSAYLSCNKGDELVISFGIKEHEQYEGEHQTKIQRVKVNT